MIKQGPYSVYLKWLFLFILGGLFVLKGLIPGWEKMQSDFPNYYVSSRVIIEGDDYAKLYDNPWVEAKGKELGIENPARFMPFPPLTSLVMLPLAPFEPLPAKRIWLIFNLILLVPTSLQLRKITQWDSLNCLLLVLCSGFALINNFLLGQMYLLLSLAILYAYNLQQQKKNLLTSALLTLGAWIKYIPVVFLLVYMYLREKKMLIYTLIISVILLGFQWLFFGSKMMLAYGQIFVPHLSGDVADQVIHAFSFQSFDSLLSNIFISDVIANPNPWIDFPLGKTISKALIFLGILASLIWLATRSKAFEKSKQKDLLLCGMGLATLLVVPVSATYHFLFLLLPVSLWIKHLWELSGNQLRVLSLIFYLGIGFGSYSHFEKIFGSEGIFLLTCYPRLFAMSGAYVCFLLLVKKISLVDK